RAGAGAVARIDQREQVLDRVVRLVAARAHDDVARAAEQRGRACLVAEPDRVGAQLGAVEVDALAGIGQQLDEPGRGSRGAGFVGAAEEGDARLLRGARRLRREIALGRLHACSRSATVSRVTIRSATSRERFSSAVCSAAMVANSEETTSMPASEPAVASTTMRPLERSTSW